MQNLFNNLPKPFFVLAPMDDVTDTVFRQIIADCAPADLYFTEFVNVDGLQSPGREKLIHKLQHTSKEKPLIAQIWGLKPKNYYKTVRELRDGTIEREIHEMVKHSGRTSLLGGFSGVDINMGCPVKTVVKNGACSALIDNRELAGEMIDRVREAAGDDFPVSVKTRLGNKQVDLSWIEFLLSKKLNMLTIHGRTAKQMSKVPADWDLIGEVVKLRDKLSPSTLIIGNGDVSSRAQGEELAKKYKLDGIMIGRGVFHDPYVFATKSPWESMSKEEKTELYKKHIKLFQDTWPDIDKRLRTLNKFCKIYINGFDGAKELRDKLMHANTVDDLLLLLDKAN